MLSTVNVLLTFLNALVEVIDTTEEGVCKSLVEVIDTIE